MNFFKKIIKIQSKTAFKIQAMRKEILTMKWVCSVCGYVHEGDQPPAECPVCHAPAEKFTKQEGELT